MSDLIERLRGRANMARDTHPVDAELDDKAADRIERLVWRLAIIEGKHTNAIARIEWLQEQHWKTKMSDCMNRRCPNAARIEQLEGIIYRNCDPMAASDEDAKIIYSIAALEDKNEYFMV
jgi:hypothetical protein